MATRVTSARSEADVVEQALSRILPAEVLRNLDSAERRGQVRDKRESEFCSSMPKVRR